jgi:hypothetical protein
MARKALHLTSVQENNIANLLRTLTFPFNSKQNERCYRIVTIVILIIILFNDWNARFKAFLARTFIN